MAERLTRTIRNGNYSSPSAPDLSSLEGSCGAVWDLQLEQHLGDVVADGLLRHAQPPRDLVVADTRRPVLEPNAHVRKAAPDHVSSP